MYPSPQYETHLSDLISVALTIKTGVVFDVGANIGQSLTKFIEADAERPYYGFEPQPFPTAVVDMYCVENGLDNKHIFQMALSDREGISELTVPGRNFASYFDSGATLHKELFNERVGEGHRKLVYTITGDSFVRRASVSDVSPIKIDVEGAELEVLRGFGDTLRQHHPIVLFGILPDQATGLPLEPGARWVAEKQEHDRNMLEFLENLGYAVYSVLGVSTLRRVRSIDFSADVPVKERDYIAIPEDELSPFLEKMRDREVED